VIPLRLDEVAAAVGGRLVDVPDPAAVVSGTVEFDSRAVTAGGLFVALPGERVDGHDFAGRAVSSGAVAVLAARPVGVPAVVVDDPLVALSALAAEVLRRLPDLTIIGITGSVGKTTTKDFTAALLRRLGSTVAPPESFNNEIGHPYTALKADAQTRFLVLENSARRIGHIAALCAVAPPRIGAVLNVGSAHLGEFGSRDAIAQAKGELIEALPADGVAILNADDPLVAAMHPRTKARVVTTGTADDADFRAVDIRLDESGHPSYLLLTRGEKTPVTLASVGAHQVPASLAAIAIAAELGLPLAEAAEVLRVTGPASRWRMEVTTRPDGVTIVNDAYNANPESMAAALRAVAAISTGRRVWAVLGVMAELGADTAAAHAEAGRLAAELGVDRLVVVGAQARPLHDAAAAEPGWRGESVLVPDVRAAIELVTTQVITGDIVLVKASHAEALERVALALLGDQR
jgi:UDP-N-acetylmuramoyl-tripeptide--D-alanyl-D-alanine ligase